VFHVFRYRYGTGIFDFLQQWTLLNFVYNLVYTIMLSEEVHLDLAIDSNAQSQYVFSTESSVTAMPLVNCVQRYTRGCGVGTYCSRVVDQGEGLYTETTSIVSVYGKHEQFVCKHCLTKIVKKAKVRSDVPSVTFCSTGCLESAGAYLDVFGEFLNTIATYKEGKILEGGAAASYSSCYEHEMGSYFTLASKFLFALLTEQSEQGNDLNTIYKVLALEAHNEIVETDGSLAPLRLAAKWLVEVLGSTVEHDILQVLSSVLRVRLFATSEPAQNNSGSSVSMITSSSSVNTSHLASGKKSCGTRNTGSGDMWMFKFLRIIKYNAQPLPIYGIQHAQLLTLLPTVARINHSCIPNSVLVYNTVRLPPNHETSSTSGVATSPVASNSNSNMGSSTTSQEDNLQRERDQGSVYRVQVSVVALRVLQPGEEATVTYLQPLCSQRTMRRELLQQGFSFLCRCVRCCCPSDCEAAPGAGGAGGTAGSASDSSSSSSTTSSSSSSEVASPTTTIAMAGDSRNDAPMHLDILTKQLKQLDERLESSLVSLAKQEHPADTTGSVKFAEELLQAIEHFISIAATTVGAPCCSDQLAAPLPPSSISMHNAHDAATVVLQTAQRILQQSSKLTGTDRNRPSSLFFCNGVGSLFIVITYTTRILSMHF
jgi:hypothetical protein